MEKSVPKSSSNSPSTDVQSTGTLCNASRRSDTSSKTSTSSDGSYKSVERADSSSSSYDADDERAFPGPNSETERSDQGDGSRAPSPIWKEQRIPFFIRNENAEIEMMLYHIRR